MATAIARIGFLVRAGALQPRAAARCQRALATTRVSALSTLTPNWRREFATSGSSGRAPADHLSDMLAEANLLLHDLIDDDDRESDDFKSDLSEVQDAYRAVCDAYDVAIATGSESEQAALRKNFDLAVVGLRDKLMALEEEAGE